MNKQQTTLLIRPAARGGKYLGKDAAIGQYSALIAILDSSGNVVDAALAEATTAQSAGPATLMDPVRRCDPYAADDNTVKVEFSVEIDKPTDFTVMVFGPLSNLDQARLATAQITLLPGVDIGTTAQFPEGIVIEVPGLRINNVKSNLQDNNISCSAMVTMMCGCQIHNDPNWFWPNTDFTIQLVTYMQSGNVYSYDMSYDSSLSTPSFFSGQWQSQASAGDVIEQAWVYAYEPKLGNQGRYQIHPTQPTPFVPNLPDRMVSLLKEANFF